MGSKFRNSGGSISLFEDDDEWEELEVRVRVESGVKRVASDHKRMPMDMMKRGEEDVEESKIPIGITPKAYPMEKTADTCPLMDSVKSNSVDMGIIVTDTATRSTDAKNATPQQRQMIGKGYRKDEDDSLGGEELPPLDSNDVQIVELLVSHLDLKRSFSDRRDSVRSSS